MLVAELACLIIISEKSDAGGVGAALMLVFVASYDFVAIVNSRTFEKADRRLYTMIVNERMRSKDLQDQIRRTNKLGRTVLAMAEVELADDGNDYESESSSKTGSQGEIVKAGAKRRTAYRLGIQEELFLHSLCSRTYARAPQVQVPH